MGKGALLSASWTWVFEQIKILTWIVGIPTRVGHNRIFNDVPSKVPWLYTHTIKLPADFETTLQAENYQAIIRGLFQTDLHANPVMSGTPLPENILRAHALLDPLPKTRMKIALCIIRNISF